MSKGVRRKSVKRSVKGIKKTLQEETEENRKNQVVTLVIVNDVRRLRHACKNSAPRNPKGLT